MSLISGTGQRVALIRAFKPLSGENKGMSQGLRGLMGISRDNTSREGLGKGMGTPHQKNGSATDQGDQSPEEASPANPPFGPGEIVAYLSANKACGLALREAPPGSLAKTQRRATTAVTNALDHCSAT